MATFRYLHSRITWITENKINRGEEERIRKIGKLISYVTYFAIFCSRIGALTQSSSASITKSIILWICFLKALLGSWRNLSWMEFQSLAPNLAKDPWGLTQFWGCDVKVTRGREPGLMHMLFFSFGVRRYSHTSVRRQIL